jgi:hypothetical protein
VQTVYREDERNEWQIYEQRAPLKNGKTLSEIPFYFFAPQEPGFDVQESPIEDLAYVNISHYQNSADLENGLHVSGLPTPWVAGVVLEKGQTISLGTGTTLVFPDPDASAGFLQVGTEGFSGLENAMDRKEAQMAALGARMLAPEKKAAEAAETAQIRRGGENSVLASIVAAVQMQLVKALTFARDWAGLTGDVSYDINKEFLPIPLGAPELTALVDAWQKGAISFDSFFDALQAGGIVSEDKTADDEKEAIDAAGPPLGTVTDPNAA